MAGYLHGLTGGNPFFLQVGLRSLHERGLLRFDHIRQGWAWELDALRRHVHPLVRDMAELVPLANTDRGAHQRLARLGGPGMRPVSYCGRFGGIAWTPDEELGE